MHLKLMYWYTCISYMKNRNYWKVFIKIKLTISAVTLVTIHPSVSTVRHVAPVVMSAFVTMGTGQGQTHGQNEGNTQHGLHGYWKTKEITSLLRSTLVWVCNQGNDPGSRSITRSERGQRTCWTSWLLKHKGKCITTPCDTWICVCNQGNDPGSRSGTLPERTELISWLLEEKTMKITLP